jgi:hypothetical protein
MIDDETVPPATPGKRNRLGLKIALVGAGIAAGAVGATAIGASAATTNGSGAAATTTAATASAPASTDTDDGPGGHERHGGHGAAPVRSDEKAVTASQAATLKAAALKAVPGGTVYRVESDAGDGAFEAHMTKADGSEVTVKFDKNLKVTGVEAGMGKGDPGHGNR